MTRAFLDGRLCYPSSGLVELPQALAQEVTGMQDIQHRSFLQLALAALPVTVLAQTASTAPVAKPVRVPAGLDREGKKHAIGLSSTT